ncbi:helix-turn-helix domain-containing protein [Sphaerisporangium melleum]|nr:helix-turn-helix domain-containing protein [Sphaerisporangium melleum]
MSNGDRNKDTPKQEHDIMPRTRIDVPKLYAALDIARRERDRSWRQLATEVGVSPSTMTRLANDYRPDVDAFAALVRWLGVPAEEFMTEDADALQHEPELLVQLAPLLRARRDLREEDVRYLEEVIGAAMRKFSAERDMRAG